MRNRDHILGSAAILALAVLIAPAAFGQSSSGQTQTKQQQASDPVDVIALSEWRYDGVYADGWSADELIEEAEAFGSEGKEIGDIENILVSEQGQILAVILEMGGFLDLGDTHIMVPWDKVEVSADLERITVPVDQSNAEEFSIYGGTSFIRKPETKDKQVVFERVATGPRVWQVTEVIDDYALLKNGIGYGYVDDLIFNKAGKLQAVVVASDFGYGTPGYFAYPYYGYGYGFDPGYPYYGLPYTADEVADLEPFDREELDD